MRKKILLLLLLINLPLLVFARGSQGETGFQQANGLENWDYTIDLSDKSEGLYNIVIRGTDVAGNEYIEGPINIYVDQDSDKPVVNISNPVDNMRVGSALNIVGTCVDDDAVQRVEVKIDDGDFVSAEGKDFWFYYLDIESIPDGVHTVTARGIDIYGVSGDEYSVMFNLDKFKPVNYINSHESGVLVSDRFTIEGNIVDANGISLLEYSSDEGETFSPINFRYDRKEDLYTFSQRIDTREMEDGPHVVWFRSTDGTNSVGSTAFLFFVDNTPPLVEVLYPSVESEVDGLVTVTGRVFDQIGIASFRYVWGEEEAEIPLTPGDFYWQKIFDFNDVGLKTSVDFVVEDLSGNIIHNEVDFNVNPQQDKPLVSINSPLSENVYQGNVFLIGGVSDDDGVASIKYSVDGGDSVSLNTEETFAIELNDLSSGLHTFAVSGVDIYGVEGDPSEISAFIAGPPAEIKVETIENGGDTTIFYPGMEITPFSDQILKGSIVFQDGISQISYQMNNRDPLEMEIITNDQDTMEFEIPLKDVPYGIVELSIKLVDEYEREFIEKTFFYVTNYTVINDITGFIFYDTRIGSLGRVSISSGNPLVGYFNGETVKNIRLEPESDIVQVVNRRGVIEIRALKEGVSSTLKIVAETTEGHIIESNSYIFETDVTPPSLEIENLTSSFWAASAFSLTGKAEDSTGIRQIQYKLDNQEYKNVIISNGSFDQAVFTNNLQEGSHKLTVTVEDNSGNKTSKYYSFVKDTVRPVVTFITPTSRDQISGRVLISGKIADEGIISSIAYTVNGTDYTNVNADDKFEFFVDFTDQTRFPSSFVVKVEDVSGNVSYTKPSFTRNPFTAITLSPEELESQDLSPSIEILNPLAGENINGRVNVGLRIINPDSIQSMSYTYGEETRDIRFTSNSPYWIHEFDFSDANGSSARVTFNIITTDGVTITKRSQFSLNKASDKPVIELSSPEEDAVLFQDGIVTGRIKDDDDISRLFYILDDNSEQSMQTDGPFLLNFPNLTGGLHQLVLWGRDSEGIVGDKKTLTFIIGEAAPQLSMTYVTKEDTQLLFTPGSSFVKNGTYLFEGEVLTNNSIDEAVYSFNSDPSESIRLQNGISSEQKNFNVTFPEDLPYGKNTIYIKLTDEYGQITEWKTFFYLLDEVEESITDQSKIYFIDEAIVGNTVFFTDRAQLRGIYKGSDVASVELNMDNSIVSMSRQGNALRIFPQNAGIIDGLKVVVTTMQQDIIESASMNFVVDFEPPEISILSPFQGDWLTNELFLKGEASDDSEISEVEYSLDGGNEFSSLPFSQTDSGLVSFSTTLSLAPFSDGSIPVILRAIDISGKSTYTSLSVIKDTVNPSIAVISPEKGSVINGLVTLSGRVYDDGRIQTVEFSEDGETYREIGHLKDFSMNLDLSDYDMNTEYFYIRGTDRAGNTSVTSPLFTVDMEKDKPVVEIQLPGDNVVIRNDFVISGMVFDDDAVETIYYRIDPEDIETSETDLVTSEIDDSNQESEISEEEIDFSLFVRLPGSNNFDIPIKIEDMTDNEHLIELYAVDINGVVSDRVQSRFLISKAEPEALMLTPSIEETIKGQIVLTGLASDANGVAAVYVSYDNGIGFHKLEGAEEWSYNLDTTILNDGTYSLQFKVVDNYETEGNYSTLINIDNTPPELKLDAPYDGEVFTTALPINGRVEDNLDLKNLHITIESASEIEEEHISRSFDFNNEGIFLESLDISDLVPGWYNLRLEAEDEANNFSFLSRNFQIKEQLLADSIDIQFPANGEHLSGFFTISGRVISQGQDFTNAVIMYDEKVLSTASIDENGFFSYNVAPDKLEDGFHSLTARISTGNNSSIISSPCPIIYTSKGPWSTINNFYLGSYINNRPWLEGNSGYYLGEEPEEAEAKQEYQAQVRATRVDKVEISFDNGKTFELASGRENWKYRIETQEFNDGPLTVLIKTTFRNGETSVVKTLFNLDETPPEVSLLSPEEGGFYNGEIPLLGMAMDLNGLTDVSINFRPGDKSTYSVPGFIQGLYFDSHFMGATDYELGLGLTFFDDVVRVQVSAGSSEFDEDQRFSGFSTGIKILANVAQLPFSYIFGPDWNFFSMSLTVGAQFSYFAQSPDIKFDLESGIVIGAIVAQWEFAKFSNPNWTFCNAIGFYYSPEFWIISSDVKATIVPGGTLGARIDLF